MHHSRPDLRMARAALGALTVAALLLAAVSTAIAAGKPMWAGRPLTATLTGAAEVPPADPDGSGTADIWVNAGQSQVCWHIVVAKIALPATAAHIHHAPVGVAGPVVVPVSAPGADGVSTGCASVSRSLAQALIRNPEQYYVNVHTTDFPGGAIRGQLHPGVGGPVRVSATATPAPTATPTATPTPTPTPTAAPQGVLEVVKVVSGSTSGFGGGTFTFAATCGGSTSQLSITMAAGALTGSTAMSVAAGTSCTVVETGAPSAGANASWGSPAYSPTNGTVTIVAGSTVVVAVADPRA